MTNSEIFKAAHKEAKLNRFSFGTYAERFAKELKVIHAKRRILKARAAKLLSSNRTIKKTTVLAWQMNRDEKRYGNVNTDDYWN